MRIPVQIMVKEALLLGVLHIPNSSGSNPKAVIMLYGLNGNRVEQHRMSVKLGAICEQSGILFARFDFRNVGLSDGDYEEHIMSQRVEDVRCIWEFLRACYGKVEPKIYFVGFSDGANTVASVLADGCICNVGGITLWNPTLKLPYEENSTCVEENYSPNRARQRIQKHPITLKPVVPLNGTWLSIEQVRFMKKNTEEYDVLKKSDIPIQFIFGADDRYTQYIYQHIIGSSDFPNAQIELVEKATHTFNEIGTESVVFTKTVNFIKGN